MLKLHASSWLFKTSKPAYISLSARKPRAAFVAPADAHDSFTVAFTVTIRQFDGEVPILEVADVLSVRLRQHDPGDRNRQNYPAFKMPDGSVPVLEATIVLHSVEHPDWQNMTIGIPLAMLKNPEGVHKIVLNFTGARWTMYVDGELLDNDFPFGYPQWADKPSWWLDAQYVKKAELHIPGICPEVNQAKKPGTSRDIQYWTPPGHNNWVGDVAALSHGGRYHMFYLYDRRHHGSKFGSAHYFEHISTEDFRTWVEHEAATPIQEQWECIGTGVPFVFDGKLAISYGLHTTRIYPREKTTLPAQWEYLEKHGRTGTFERAATTGIPAGSTYSVCVDGVSRFKKSGIMFHPCENPSVYTDPSGKLRLMANYQSNGIWESDMVDGGWRCVSPGFPPGGDCTFFFRWGQFDYILGGFTGLWSKPAEAPDLAYQDMVSKGLDFYDGSNVPSIAAIASGRFLMAAWIPIRGWGGNLVIRELLQLPDGRLGSKWMKEIMPRTAKTEPIAAAIEETAEFPAHSKAFMLTLSVSPSKNRKGRFAISFLPEDGEAASCELQIKLDNSRAQFGPGSLNGFAANEKSLREGGAPQYAGNYAIENLINVGKTFTVRVIVKGCDKLGGTLIDVEIAGQRTMITYRPELTVKKIVLRAEGVTLMKVRQASLKH